MCSPSTPGLDEPLADLDRLLEGRPLLPPGEERLPVVDRADLELEVEVVPDLLPHRAHDLDREARAVLQRPAVLVLPVVDRRGEELRDQVAVAAVDLDAVELGLARPAGGLPEGVDDLVDLRLRHPLARKAVDRVGLVRGGEPLVVEDARDVPLPAGEGELDDVRRPGLAHALPQLRPERHLVVGVEVGVVGDDRPARMDRRVRGDHRPDSTARELDVPVHAGLRAGAVVVVEAPRDARAEEPVLHLEMLELQRLEDRRPGCLLAVLRAHFGVTPPRRGALVECEARTQGARVSGGHGRD